jgi:hypothetical protein
MKNIIRNSFPVCFLSKSSLLIFKNCRFSIFDLKTGKTSKSFEFKTSFKEEILTGIPILARILRKGVRCGIKVSDKLVIFVIGKRIYELNLESGLVSDGFITSDDTRPLTFSKIEGIKGFDDGIYFGGYKENQKMDPISLYKRTQPDLWEEVFTFPEGTVEHIHNIIADPERKIVYVLTGDFEKSAGIWIAKDGFRSVTPLLVGDQNYRGVVGFITSEGLVYATDSPFSQNSIRLLKQIGDNWETIKITDISGPATYGCKWNDDYIFSTSVEGGGRNLDLKYQLTGRKRGKGVFTEYSIIYKGNLREGFREIYRAKKDSLPFFLFQFGVLIFPSGLNESNLLPVYHIATSKHGMNTILLK